MDGTKEFIKGRNDFTVNIALIKEMKPVLGVIYAPKYNFMYSAFKRAWVFQNGIKIYNNSKRQNLVAADSRHHSSKKTESFLKKK